MYKELSTNISSKVQIDGMNVRILSEDTNLLERSFTLKSPKVPLSEVEQCDVVSIKDSDLDWLRDNYNEHFDGNPLPLFSKKFTIKIFFDKHTEDYGKKTFLFVRALDDVYLQVDLYQSVLPTRSMWTEVIINEQLEQVSSGMFEFNACTAYDDEINPNPSAVPDNIKKESTTYINDITRYILFFMSMYADNREVVTRTKETKRKISNKKGKKAKATTTHRMVYVPKKVVKYVEPSRSVELSSKIAETDIPAISEGQNGNVKKQPESKSTIRPYFGDIEEWPTRGYKRRHTRKDGTIVEVEVKPSVHRRNPAKLRNTRKSTEYKVSKPSNLDKKSN